jgi:hypothetical protein
MSLWGDPKTGLPVRIEATVAMMPNAKITMSDFEFNVAMDESLFSVEPPAGYKVTEVQDHMIDDSPKKERDLIEMFRYYGKWNGKRFPDLLDMMWLDETVRMVEWCASNISHPSEAKRNQDLADAETKLDRGMTFVVFLPKEADSHYAGRGISLGAADKAVFWYRPKDSKKYRIIYADLSVRKIDTPPRMPAMQPEQDLIDTFRYYTEVSGGPFPTKLDMEAISWRLFIKFPLKKG